MDLHLNTNHLVLPNQQVLLVPVLLMGLSGLVLHLIQEIRLLLVVRGYQYCQANHLHQEIQNLQSGL